ncbi:MAG: hypothetical protein WCR56_00990 [Bacilli bacterium]
MIDGFGGISVDGKNYNYVIGNDNRILVYDSSSNYVQKYIFVINVSSKIAVEILEEDKKTMVTNTTGSSSSFYYNDKQYTCYAVNYTFDGYGFVTVKNGQGAIQSFFSYTYYKDSESIEISSSFYQHSVSFAKTDAITYVNNDNNMNFLSSSYAVFNGTAITFADAD